MLSRLFVSVRRARLRNARAVTARPFIEINIPEAERRFYTELAGAPLGSYRGVYLAPAVEWLGLSALGTSKALKRFDFHAFPGIRAFRTQVHTIFPFYDIYLCLFLMITAII